MNPESTNALVLQARVFAMSSHDACGHTRSDGAPYWTHPERVVATLAAHGLASAVLAAAWLHDVAEDCPPDEAGCREMIARLSSEFGAEVGALVDEVTNYCPPGVALEEKQRRLREHARTMSVDAKWIKLADRWDNISGMEGWSEDKKRRYAVATHLLLEALHPWPEGAEGLVARIAAAASHYAAAPFKQA